MLQNVHKSHPIYAPFKTFCKFYFVRLYLRNFDANLCENDAIILVSAVLYNAAFTISSLRGLLGFKPIYHVYFTKESGPNTSVTLQMA